MSINEIALVFQIIFYIVGSTIAILTYLAAKRGLLNTVNTEYHKRSMDHLELISKKLFEISDFSSDEFWVYHSNFSDEYLSDIVEGYKKRNDKKGEDNAFLLPGVKANDYIQNFENVINGIKSEPFLPETITKKIINSFEKKIETWQEIEFEEILQFKIDLSNNLYNSDLENASSIVANKIIDRRYEEGCGISQLEDEVKEIRIYIRDYLKTFDPFYKKRSI